ncbi:MAG: HPr family phosphocarrier protein [Sporomusaceae bacterium]|nr:HPr family phosphocarrier protein [Sporomusaceae bacterium]
MDSLTEVTLKVTNPTGLHARPAARLVQQAAAFRSRVSIAGNNKQADAKSILAVMSLGLAYGSEIVLTADGEDEQACIAALTALFAGNFGED